VITLDKVFDTDVQVTYQIVPGSASVPSDFFDGMLTATITIPAGQSSFTVPIQIVRDATVEGNESFHIVLIDAVNATINPDKDSASVTIFNDDSVVFNIDGSASVVEGNSATYVVSYAGVLGDGQSASVHVATGAGVTVTPDAAAGVDYNPLTQTLTFSAGGASSVNLVVATHNDAVFELTEEY